MAAIRTATGSSLKTSNRPPARRRALCIVALALVVAFDGVARIPWFKIDDASRWQTALDRAPEDRLNNGEAAVRDTAENAAPKPEENASTDPARVEPEHTTTTDHDASIIADRSDNITTANKNMTTRSDGLASHRSPWANVAPVVEPDELPTWITNYVTFHNESLAQATSAKEDKNYYLIYTCTKSKKETKLCSGTGNRQGAIAAMFVVAMLTGRVLLIDMDNPVALSSVLQPNLIQWNAIPEYLDEMPSVFLNLRSDNRPDLNVPSSWQKEALTPQVIRVLANKPPSLKRLWKTSEVQSHLADKGWVKKQNKRLANKYIFYTLFRPSKALAETLAENRRMLRINSWDDPYTSIHLRLGTGFGEQPHHGVEVSPKTFLDAAVKISVANNISEAPIVVITDTTPVKTLLHEMEPTRVRYANNTVLHVDLFNKDTAEAEVLEAALNVWADILILAQSQCLVMSHGTFSLLALWISEPELGYRCRDETLVGD